jgi:hypothetical protein
MNTALGSGLSVDHNYTAAPKPNASREGPGRFRAEISGSKDGAAVYLWKSAETYPSMREALAVATAKATE